MIDEKQFIFIFRESGPVGNLVHTGNTNKDLLEYRPVSGDERQSLRIFMEQAKAGHFKPMTTGYVVCTGVEPGAPPPVYIDDEGHGVTEKSRKVFMENRHEVYPIQCVGISWDGEMTATNTRVFGADGGIIALSGFGIGYSGEGFRGMCWLLDQCGIGYEQNRLRAMDMKAPGELTLYPMKQTADMIALCTYGDDDGSGLWEALVKVQREDGTEITIEYPGNEGVMFDSIEELIDIILLDCRFRGIEWTADPRLLYNDEKTLVIPAWNKTICPQQSERIGWNYDKAD